MRSSSDPLIATVALPLAALLAILLVSATPLQAQASRELKLHQLDGRPFSLESLKGSVVVLDFWATWCVPCRSSFPFFDRLQQEYGAKGLKVVGLTLEEDGDAVTDFLEGVPAGFTIARDPTGHAGEVYEVVAMPTTFLLDRSGTVVARFEGGGKPVHDKLESAVGTVLAGQPLPGGTGVRVSRSLEATGGIKAWQRGYLADPIMSLDGTPAEQIFREHIHASKEAAAGNGGPAGGGCGCN